MADDFAQYEVKPEDDFSQYEVKSEKPVSQKEFTPHGLLPGLDYLMRLATNPTQEARAIVPNVAIGAANAGQNVAKTVLGDKATNFDFDSIRGNSLKNEFAQGIGQYGALGPLSELAGAYGAGSEALGALSRTGRAFGAGTAYGATQGNALQTGLMNTLPILAPRVLNALDKLPEYLNSGKNSLLSNNLLGNYSNSQVRQNLVANEGLPTNLGNVLGSPYLKKLHENALANLPLTGATQSLNQTANAIDAHGSSVLKNLLGDNDPRNVEKSVNDALINVQKAHTAEKNALYNTFNDAADKSGINLGLSNFGKTAKNYKSALENTTILKDEPEDSILLKTLSRYINPVKKVALPNTEPLIKTFSSLREGSAPDIKQAPEFKNVYPTFKEANLLKGRLNELANDLGSSSQSSDRRQAQMFGSLAKAIKTDISSALENHPDVLSHYNTAEENYKNKFSQFLDKDIYKFGRGNADSDDILSAFINTGKSKDKANQLNKLMNTLPANEQKLVGYGYLARRAFNQDGSFNSRKLANAISTNQLGPRQFEALFPDTNIRNSLLRHQKLTFENDRALRLMENPYNGQTANTLLGLAGLAGGATNPLGTASALGAYVLGTRGLNHILTNEKVRKNVVNALLKLRGNS